MNKLIASLNNSWYKEDRNERQGGMDMQENQEKYFTTGEFARI